MWEIVPVKAIRIHEDGGPEVLRYEDAPDPVPGTGHVLIELRAASLNHLDVWVRKGLPSVPKPRILGADGAGIVVSGEGFAPGDRVVINPGLDHGDGRIIVIGEHTDGTHAELISVPREQVYPLPDHLSTSRTAAAFPLVFETAYRMLVTRAGAAGGEWVLVWGIGGGVAHARRSRSPRRSARALSPPRPATTSCSARGELGADATFNHATDDVAARVKERHGRRRARRRRAASARRPGSTRSGRRPRGRPHLRLRRDDRPEPAGEPPPHLVEAAHGLGSTMGTKEDFEAVYELVTSGRARPVVDEVFPLAEAAAAHERLEAGEQLGKIVLRIPN